MSSQAPLDLSCVFALEPHAADTYVGESPDYAWGTIYGGLVIAQALWAATQTVDADHRAHSLHAYFILVGDPAEPIRYEVDRVRDGRSFTTRRVVARQRAGAIATLEASFQRDEPGPEMQTARAPATAGCPADFPAHWDAGLERRDALLATTVPRSLTWTRFPASLTVDSPVQACALAYLSDLNPMDAVMASHPEAPATGTEWDGTFMGVSLDHSLWFHRPVRADGWLLLDLASHGLVGTRGLVTGSIFGPDGTHAATIAQEGLLRRRRPT